MNNNRCVFDFNEIINIMNMIRKQNLGQYDASIQLIEIYLRSLFIINVLNLLYYFSNLFQFRI